MKIVIKKCLFHNHKNERLKMIKELIGRFIVTRYRYCRGCKYEFDNENCKNIHLDKDSLKHKDGSYKCGYCAWKEPLLKEGEDYRK